jgi:hypothetical protein
VLVRKQIAGALVASLLIGSAPGWAEEGGASPRPAVTTEARRQALRDSIDRAVEGKAAPGAGQALTERERADLEIRRAALKTDPVASGAAGILISLVATAASIGLTLYLLKKTKDSTTLPAMGRP